MHRLHESDPWMRAIRTPPLESDPPTEKTDLGPSTKKAAKKPKKAPPTLVTPKVKTHEPPGVKIITSQAELVEYFKEQGLKVPPPIQAMLSQALGKGAHLSMKPLTADPLTLQPAPAPASKVGLVRGIMAIGTVAHYRTWYAMTPQEAHVMKQALFTLGMHILDPQSKAVPCWYRPDWIMEMPKELYNLTEEYSRLDQPDHHLFSVHTFVTREEILRFRGPHRFHVEDEARMGSFVDQPQMGKRLELEMKPLPPGADNKPRNIRYHRVVIDRIPV